ncbi:MAG: methyltransferase domain-containing protein [Thermoleophilaceae bacterium]|nr:methyltransferase domain-containing protein [Thermoleophilaceae bacterium]
MRLADPGPQDRVVDIATGTGVLLRALAARDPRPAKATGVDRSVGMLAQVGRLPGDWLVIHGDARCVPLPDGAADVVTCCYLLHLLGAEDRGRVLREARRLLRSAPGSRLVIVTVWANPGTIGGRVLNGLLPRLAAASPRRWGGLMPLDPMAELGPAGLVATHRVVLPRGGYPSLVVRARVA